jgi:D-amino-acid oxidase
LLGKSRSRARALSDIIDAMRITVVGAGVIGLTVACRLADDGHDLRLIAAALPHDTTSSVAAAIWYPYRAYPQADVTRWAAFTYRALTELTEHDDSGVRMRSGRELCREPTADPWWASAVPDLERLTDVPQGYRDGFRLTVPVIDMSAHLDWLAARLAKRRIPIELRALAELDDAPGDLIVNCTGLGARTLLDDQEMTPVRGQVIVVEQFGLDEWTLDDSDDGDGDGNGDGQPTYIVPRERTVVLGGTAEAGLDDMTARPDIAEGILERCARLVPAVKHARILAHRVGLRPGRTAVRLERGMTRGGRTVIHCYGHGGAGVTLARGCAEDIAALATA